jgi:hypothetical protein
VDGRAVAGDTARLEIDDDAVALDPAERRLQRRAAVAQRDAHARQQLADAERLHQVVVGAGVEQRDLAGLVARAEAMTIGTALCGGTARTSRRRRRRAGRGRARSRRAARAAASAVASLTETAVVTSKPSAASERAAGRGSRRRPRRRAP